MEQPLTAVYDANILYPAPIRDLFIRLAQAGLVRAKWTDTIHDEWMRNVLKDNPHLSAERLARTRTLMDAAVRDCLITGHEELIASLALPDPDDRHVLAAAIHAGADVIVTCNLADFPDGALARFNIQAQHPDDFLVYLLDEAPGVAYAAVKQQRESLRNPPKTAEELLATLESHGLIQAVVRSAGSSTYSERRAPPLAIRPQCHAKVFPKFSPNRFAPSRIPETTVAASPLLAATSV